MMMYERMLDKENPPSENAVMAWLGVESNCRLMSLEEFLNGNYELTKELKFPFGNRYGWGYKYGHRSSHLCYIFFEAGAFTVTLQLGDALVKKVEQALPAMTDKTKKLWETRYPCGDHGGWIHDRVLSQADLRDVFTLIKIKKKPMTAE
jgi:hypothetical protein